MKVIDVYSQYFNAHGVFNDVERKGALVKLTATSEEGNITYETSVTFFPYRDEEDFAISYGAYFSQILSSEKGRRSKKKDEMYLGEVQRVIDELTEPHNAKVFWEKPIRDAVYD